MRYADDSTNKFTIISKAIIVFAGIIIGLLLTRIFFTTFKIKGNSMNPNFKNNETIIVLKHTSKNNNDLILLKSPVENNKYLLSRIVASEGDTIEIKNKVLLINGVKNNLTQKIISKDSKIFPIKYSFRDNLPKFMVKKGFVFVLNDNRDKSFDSRTYGAINIDLIVGKFFYKF